MATFHFFLFLWGAPAPLSAHSHKTLVCKYLEKFYATCCLRLFSGKKANPMFPLLKCPWFILIKDKASYLNAKSTHSWTSHRGSCLQHDKYYKHEKLSLTFPAITIKLLFPLSYFSSFFLFFFFYKCCHVTIRENYLSGSRQGKTIHLTNTRGEWSWSVETPVKKLGPNGINHHQDCKWSSLITRQTKSERQTKALTSTATNCTH